MLTRKPGEKLIITTGDTQIVVMVGNIQGNQVSVGVQAPRSVTIDREEIAQRKANGEPRHKVA
jgi:carbon storage regulator CsrA